MANFNYRIITKEGKEKSGSLDAEDQITAVAQLKSEGNTVISVKAGSKLNTEIKFGSGKKVNVMDLSAFCRQFNSLLKAGVGVITALDMLGDQTENRTLTQSIYNVRDGVQKGDTLANSMKKEDCFPSLLVSMMEAGEQSGNIEISLERMAEHFEKDGRAKAALKKAMMYPCVLLVVMVGVIIVMLTFVIPNFVSMFEDLESDLPFMTKAVLSMSDAVMNYWYIIIAVIAAIVVGYKMYAKTDAGRHSVDKLKLKIPVFGVLQTKTACASFARTLSTLLQAGMPMIEAIDIAASTMTNVMYKAALMKAKSGVALGLPLSNQLKASQIFPPMIVHMVGIGEETGNIEEMLTNSAGYYEEEVEVQTQTLTALMEPAIIVIMALVVVVLILSIYQPMIQLYNTLG